MESIVVSRNIFTFRHHFASSPLIPSPPPPPQLTPFRRRRQPNHAPPISLSAAAAPSTPSPSLNGWDDLASSDVPAPPIFALSDGKTVALFLLGFVSALSVCRARISTIAIIPASIFAFAAAGMFVEASRRRRLDGKQAELLVRFVDGLDEKMMELERIVKEDRVVELREISRFLDVVEAVRAEGSSAKKVVVDGGYGNAVKSSKGKREMSVLGSEFARYLGVLFRESLASIAAAFKANKEKEAKRESVVEQRQKGLTGNVKENAQILRPVDDASVGSSIGRKSEECKRVSESLRFRKEKEGEIDGYVELGNDYEVPNSSYSGFSGKDSSNSRDGKYDDYLSSKKRQENINGRLNFTSRQRSLEAMIIQRMDKRRNTQRMEGDYDYSNGTISSKAKETNLFMFSESESSLEFQSTVNRPYVQSDGGETETTFKQDNHNGGLARPEDSGYISDDLQSVPNSESTLYTSGADGFTQRIEEATALLKQARECMRNGSDKEMADTILYKSAELLSTAVAMKPMSLLAVGQLGNTLLLHGEIKLKFSREMRSILSEEDLFMSERKHRQQFDGFSSMSLSKEKVAAVLVDVCEECEELLIEAGKNYNVALSIDGNDIRALYNWGLALYFRAELLADVGPEAAFDADKVYLAAIDKFAAMTSRSNAYASDALFKWGLALQQRSNLRPRNRKEKIKLLKQAKSLYEEVLSTDSNNQPAREALRSCLSEIKYNKQF